jgi:Ca-activated chloride channel family protein
MIIFAAPWFALALPLPLLIIYLAPPRTEAQSGVAVPFFTLLAHLTGQTPIAGGTIAKRSLARTLNLALCWLLLIATLMRPQAQLAPLHREEPTRDMLLLVDLSASMDTQDFTNAAGKTVDRVTAVKEVLNNFLKRRQGDRVGVVVFGTTAYPLIPFTADLNLVRQELGDMQPGMAGPRTAIGDAIGLGITLFAHSPMQHKVMILLTDGNDTASEVLPGDAARIARDQGITIHTIAIGDPHAVGEDAIDEPTLQDIAQATGGGFYRAMDYKQLDQIYTRLDEIETHKVQTLSARPRADLYWYPLGALLLLTMGTQAAGLLRRTTRRKAALA